MEYTFNNENFDTEVLKSNVPVLVDMFAVWCGPCKMMSPIIAQIAEEYEGRAKVGKADIDKSPELADKYGISAVPTLIIFKGGRPIKAMVGMQSAQALRAALDEAL